MACRTWQRARLILAIRTIKLDEMSSQAPAAEAESETDDKVCPLCDGREFIDDKTRVGTKCAGCGSLPRTRVCWLMIDKHVPLKQGSRVLHLAPEKAIAKKLHERCGDGYEPVDYDAERYSGITRITGRPVRKFNLCADAANLPSDTYDLVVHNHVLEHIPCNYTRALQELHRAVAPGGTHLFSVPMNDGYYQEDLDPNTSTEERLRRFGRVDHLRRFGRANFEDTLGAVFGLKNDYSIEPHLSRADIKRAHLVGVGKLGMMFYIVKQP